MCKRPTSLPTVSLKDGQTVSDLLQAIEFSVHLLENKLLIAGSQQPAAQEVAEKPASLNKNRLKTTRQIHDDDLMTLANQKCEAPIDSNHSKLDDDQSRLPRKRRRKTIVDHQYHDHANDPLERHVHEKPNKQLSHKNVSKPFPFPFVLHKLLSEQEEAGMSHVVSWRSHGRAFVVHDPDAFVKDVLPLYFRQNKMSSFTRQLNLYGFVRLTNKGLDKGGYYHEYFLRGRVDLCVHIRRPKKKGSPVRLANNPSTEPDFEFMQPVGTCVESRSASLKRFPSLGLDTQSEASTAFSDLEEDFLPRPLPPAFDDSLVSTVQKPMVVRGRHGKEKLLFHVNSSAVNSERDKTDSPQPTDSEPLPCEGTADYRNLEENEELYHFLSGINLGF